MKWERQDEGNLRRYLGGIGWFTIEYGDEIEIFVRLYWTWANDWERKLDPIGVFPTIDLAMSHVEKDCIA